MLNCKIDTWVSKDKKLPPTMPKTPSKTQENK